MLRRSITAIALALGVAIAPQAARAAGEYDTPPPANLSFQGFFGTFDRASAQRGLQVYRQVCASCHGLRLVAFRNLRALGLTDEQIAAIAAEYQIQDGPNDEGQMFERPGRPSDRFRSPFPNERAARAASSIRPAASWVTTTAAAACRAASGVPVAASARSTALSAA